MDEPHGSVLCRFVYCITVQKAGYKMVPPVFFSLFIYKCQIWRRLIITVDEFSSPM